VELFEDAQPALADADLRLSPHWVEPALADEWLRRLLNETPWARPTVRLHGRDYPVPRQVAWYGDPEARYGYSGLTHEPLAWTPLLADIRARVEEEVGQRFNGVLLNHYRDGGDSMGWHSDDEAVLGRDPVIASLNLGGARRFDLRRRGTTRIGHSLWLTHGALLVMAGPTQHHWQHQVAKTRAHCAPRLNLTFRLLTFTGARP